MGDVDQHVTGGEAAASRLIQRRRLPQSAPKTHRELDCNLSTDHFSHPDVARLAITMSTSELASSYAALILADDGVDITVRIRQLRT